MNFNLAPEEYGSINTLVSPEVERPVIFVDELEALCGDSEILKEKLALMLTSCLEYTISVAEWQESFEKNKGRHTEDFVGVEKLRGSKHGVAISAINRFSLELRKHGKDNSWMDKARLDGKNRAAYTKFALTLSLSRLGGSSLPKAA